MLEATATLIQLRIGANAKEVELAQSQLTTAKELERIRQELDKLKAEGGSGAASATRLSGPGRRDALLAVEFGQRREVARGVLPANLGTPGPGTLPKGVGEPKQ